jgi:hypothetical protein
MGTHHDVQVDFAIAIGIWVSALIAAVVTAIWRSRAGMSPKTEAASDHDRVAKPVHGATATWTLAEPVPAPAPDQPTVVAVTRERSPSDAVVDGPYEFYEWL